MLTKSRRCGVDVEVCVVAMFWLSKCRIRDKKRVWDLTCRHVHASTGIDRQPRLSELHKDADELMCARTCTGEVASKCLHTYM
jgi:hypothetical protein